MQDDEKKHSNEEEELAPRKDGENPSHEEENVDPIKDEDIPSNEEEEMVRHEDGKIPSHEEEEMVPYDEGEVSLDKEEEMISRENEDVALHEDEDVALLEEAVEEGHMTFLEHLDELRIVIFKSAASFLLAFMLVAVFFRQITGLLRTPIEKAMSNHGITEALVTTSPFGVFSFLLQMGFMGGIALASPFILYFASSFIAPGLTDKERRTLLPGAIVALLLFTIGCIFSYVVLVPSALNVSIYLNKLLGFSLVWAADRYMSLLMWMVLGIGLSFEFPLIITILVYVGILTYEQLKSFRRYAIVLIFVLAAFITPTADPITQSLMAGPMLILYEASIWVSRFIERKRKREFEEEFGAWDDDGEIEKDDYYHD